MSRRESQLPRDRSRATASPADHARRAAPAGGASRHPRSRTAPRGRPAAFTLIEVMVAAAVLVLGITTSITTLQMGFRAVDTARNYTFASQVMQSEMERLRLKSWAQIETLQNSGETRVEVPALSGVAAATFTCTRTITNLRDDMKEVVLLSAWRGIDGRTHAAKFITRYARNGLYDYFYTAR